MSQQVVRPKASRKIFTKASDSSVKSSYYISQDKITIVFTKSFSLLIAQLIDKCKLPSH